MTRVPTTWAFVRASAARSEFGRCAGRPVAQPADQAAGPTGSTIPRRRSSCEIGTAWPSEPTSTAGFAPRRRIFLPQHPPAVLDRSENRHARGLTASTPSRRTAGRTGSWSQIFERLVRAPELEQADTELDAGLQVTRICGQRPAQVLGRRRMLAVVDQHGAYAVLRARMVRRDRKRAGIGGFGLRALALHMVDAAELDPQFDRSRQRLEPVLDRRDGFVETAQ